LRAQPSTESFGQGRLYRLAKRLSLGRLLRYGALWARYGLRRAQSALLSGKVRGPETDAAAQAAALAGADVTAAKRMAVASWFPLDLANARLHRALLASIAAARADLGVTPEILDCIESLKAGDDLTAAVDAMAERGVSPQTVNTALYMLLLRRLPAPSEMLMIVSRHPRHALIAIQSGDEFRKQGRRTEAS
jgi:hypothetical protein